MSTDATTRTAASLVVPVPISAIVVDPIHNGPPDSGHGGVTAGLAANLVDPMGAVVRIHTPIPLSTRLVPAPADWGHGSVTLSAGGSTVLTVRPLEEALCADGVDGLVAPAEIVAAERHWLDRSSGVHPYPTCFACGPARSDGLGLQPGQVAGRGTCATRWLPAGSGTVPIWKVWAAMDCGSAGPPMASLADGDRLVTGEIAVEVRTAVEAGVTHQLQSALEERSGRKIRTRTALVAPDGTVAAVARVTWFTIPGGPVS